MNSYKIKVSNEAESKEAQELFFELGCENNCFFANDGMQGGVIYSNGDVEDLMCKEITLPQLRDMVVLKRNDVNDKNAEDGTFHDLYKTSDSVIYFYHHHKKEWMRSHINEKPEYLHLVKPIQEKQVASHNIEQQALKANPKLFLDSKQNYAEIEWDGSFLKQDHWVEVPEGANFYCAGYFWLQLNSKKFWNDPDWQDDEVTLLSFSKRYEEPIVWQRTQDNSLPFIDDESKLIKSDGGSSKYHQRKIPEKMLNRWNETGCIEVKDVIRLFLNNDFTRGNIFKAHSRISSLENGLGKDGASKEYDLNKVLFFAQDDIDSSL